MKGRSLGSRGASGEGAAPRARGEPRAHPSARASARAAPRRLGGALDPGRGCRGRRRGPVTTPPMAGPVIPQASGHAQAASVDTSVERPVSDEQAKPSDRVEAERAEAKPSAATPDSGTDPATAAKQAEAGAERRDLPKWNRARVKRKAPAGEEQDAFQVSVRKAGRGILQRPWAVIGIIVGVSALGAGAYAWTEAAEGDRAAATRTLATAVAYEARGQVFEDLAAQTAERVRPLPIPVVSDEASLRTAVDEALTGLEEQAPSSPANE